MPKRIIDEAAKVILEEKKEEIGKPFIEYYSPKIYKSDPRNWSVIEDNRGVLYFGNQSGILEFDGNFWRKIKVKDDQNVRSLAVDKNGKIYVCASEDADSLQSRLARERRQRVCTLPSGEGSPLSRCGFTVVAPCDADHPPVIGGEVWPQVIHVWLDGAEPE